VRFCSAGMDSSASAASANERAISSICGHTWEGVTDFIAATGSVWAICKARDLAVSSRLGERGRVGMGSGVASGGRAPGNAAPIPPPTIAPIPPSYRASPRSMGLSCDNLVMKFWSVSSTNSFCPPRAAAFNLFPAAPPIIQRSRARVRGMFAMKVFQKASCCFSLPTPS